MIIDKLNTDDCIYILCFVLFLVRGRYQSIKKRTILQCITSDGRSFCFVTPVASLTP